MSNSFAPLRHRDFALFWTGAFVSNIGTWMETIALSYYVAATTGKAFWSGLIAAAGFVPIGLLGPIGGAIADRVDRRHLLLATTASQTMFAAVVTVAMFRGHPPVWLIAVIAFGSGCASAVGFPAYQATIPELVPPEELVAAIALGSAQWNLGRIIGPVAAGLVISLAGVSAALLVNTLSFFAVIAALLVITLPAVTKMANRPTLLASIRDGTRFVRGEPGLRVMFAAMCATIFLAAPFIALIPIMATRVLHGNSRTNSTLVTAQGIGAVAAALLLGPLAARLGPRHLLRVTVTAVPIALIVYGIGGGLWTTALALVLLGGCYLAALSSFTSIAQQRAPRELRGRVLSLNNVILGLLYPLGALIQGRLGDVIGIRRTTIGAGVILLALVVVTAIVRPGFTKPLEPSQVRAMSTNASAATTSPAI